jgi:hypothetical protein
MYRANQSSIGCGRRWNSRYPSHRAVVPSIHGREPPDPGTIADAVLGPLYRRALWGTLPADPAYPSSLVDRLLSPTCHNDPNT